MELRRGDITDFTINRIGDNRINLTIFRNNDELLEYEINSNPENPDINIIINELRNGFNELLELDDAIITLWEQHERNHLYITFPNGNLSRYNM